MNVNQTNRNKNPLLSCAVTGGFEEFTGSGIVLAAAEKPVFTIGTPAISDTDNFSDVSLDRDAASDTAAPLVDAFVSPLAELDSMGNLQSNAPPTLDLNQDQQQIDANLNPISAAFAQLPTAASTVFSTFSNIIKGSPSQQRFEQQPQMQTSPVMTHETTSDNVNTSGYMMAPSYDPNAPPPALFSPADESLFKKQVVEPPTNNTFRLGGHKKKTYAHIPGLSTHHQSPALQNFSPNPMMPPIPPQPTPVETVAPNSYYQEYQPPQPAYSQPQREPEKTNKFSLTSLLPSQLLEKIPSTKNLFGAGEPSTQQQQYQPQPFNGDQDFSVMTSTFEQPPQASSYFNAPPQNAAQFGAVSEPQNVNQMPLPPVSYFNPQQFNTNPFMHQAAAEPAVQQSVAPPMMPPMTIPAQPAAVATPPAAAPFNQGMFNPAPFSDVASEPPKIAAVSAETNLPPPTFFNPVEATQMFNAASNDAKPKNPYSSSRISRGVGMYKTRAPNDIASNQPVMMPPMPDPAASYQQAPVAQFTQSGVSQFTQPCVSQFMPTPEPQKVPSRPSSIPPLPVASFGTTSAETPQNVFAPPQASPSLHFGQPFQAAAVPSFQAAPVQTFQAAPAQPPPAASFFFDQTQSQQPVQTQSQPPMQAQSQPQVQKFQEHDVPRRKKSDLNVPEVSRTPPTFFSPPAVNQVDGNVPPVQNHRLVQSPPVNQVYEAPAPAENHSKPDFFTPEASKGHANVFQPVPTASEDVAEQEACNFQPPPSIAPPIESVSTTATPSAVNFFEPPLSSISNSEFSSSHSSSNSTAVNFFQPPAEEAPQPPGTMAPPQQQQKFFQPSPTSAFGDLSAADSLAPQCGSATSQPRFFDSPLSMSVASDATSNSANAGTSAMSFFQSSLNNEALSVSNTRSNSSAAPSINFFNPEPSVPDSPASNNVANTTPSDFFMDGSVVSPVEASKLNEELDDASVYSTSMLNNETVTEVYDKLDSLSMSEVHGSALSLFATSELDASSMQKSAPFESLIPKYLDTQASAPRSTSSPALPKNYRAVYRHWFYQNLYWHPFAMSDSLALDDAIANGREIVVTDGGRFEVNLTQRRRASIYWTSGTNAIRRCSWFYKNPQGHEHNLLPFDEETADFMEAEYEKAVLNNTWGHRLQIPASDSFLTFRDAANIEFHQTGQTLVVKRGVDEFVIDDGEVEAIDHLIVSVSSFGDKIDDSADELRSKCFETMQHYYSEALDCGQIGRVEVLPISLNSIDVLRMKETNMTIEAAPGGHSELPTSTTYQDIIMKTAFYCHHEYYQNIMNHLAFSLKDIVTKFRQRNEDKAKISLIATSFEALFLFDLLHNQDDGPEFWKLDFDITNFYAFGMPSSLLMIRNAELFARPMFDLKTCKKFFNVVHRLDPIAQRIEPFVQPESSKLPPESIENESPDRFDFTIADGSSLESFSLKNYFTSELVILKIASEIYGSLKMDSGSL